MSLRVVFFGSGDIGVPTLEWLISWPGARVAAVVTQPDRPSGRGLRVASAPVKELALRAGIPVFQPARLRESVELEALAKLESDLHVVMAYGQILPVEVLQQPRIACLNLHASLLPRHRGASPIHAAILAGDSESGITLMHMAEGLDTGDMVLSRRVSIRRRETSGSLHDRLAALAPLALADAWNDIVSGSVPRIPQNDSMATYAPKLDRAAGRIDWSQPARCVERFIRAMNPWPGAHTFLPSVSNDPVLLKIHSAIAVMKISGPAGRILHADHRGLVIACGDGGLWLRQVQLAGKKSMDSTALLRGSPWIREGLLLK
jgi:methionyl-tRNA formyltransferase